MIPFIVANGILWLTLSVTVWLSSVLPAALLDIFRFESFASIATGSAVGILIGRSYDPLISFASDLLPRPITPSVFAVASLFIIALILAAAFSVHIPVLENPGAFPGMFYLAFALIGYGAFEVWKFLPESIPLLPQLVFAMMLGCILFGLAFLAPVYTFGQFVDYYNAGFASYVAGWSAGLTSRALKQQFRDNNLEIQASGALVKGLVQREAPVLLAVVIAYIGFRVGGFNPLLFSLTVGVIGAFLANLFADAVLSE